jgi:hypothetical protein
MEGKMNKPIDYAPKNIREAVQSLPDPHPLNRLRALNDTLTAARDLDRKPVTTTAFEDMHPISQVYIIFGDMTYGTFIDMCQDMLRMENAPQMQVFELAAWLHKWAKVGPKEQT